MIGPLTLSGSKSQAIALLPTLTLISIAHFERIRSIRNRSNSLDPKNDMPEHYLNSERAFYAA